MCGIVGYIGTRDCVDMLVDSLARLEYRGYDSSGIAVAGPDGIQVRKAAGRLANLRRKLAGDDRPKGHAGIGHTRWATHGAPSDVNAHPQGTKDVMLVHNGIIENYREIEEFLAGKGYTFASETDTERAACLIDWYYRNNGHKPQEALREALDVIRGSYAFAILFRDFPDRLYAVRCESPLVIGLGDGENFIGSDVTSFISCTKKYYLLEKGEIAEVRADGVTIRDLDGTPLKKKIQTADWDVSAAEKGGYPHFMLKEIHEQPEAVRAAISPRIRDGLPWLEGDGIDTDKLPKYRKLFFVACGTAMHAGLVAKYVIERTAGVEVTVDVASEFRYRDPLITKDDLFVAISQSGETADTLAALRLAKEKGADTIGIVNVVGSSIAREVDHVLYTYAGPEISVASTKAYMVQIAVVYLISMELALKKGRISRAQCEAAVSHLQEMPDVIAQVLEEKDTCSMIASRIMNAESLLYIGRGLDYALSMEGSLKLKEISYIHSESYAAGELKHGTISLVTEGMPVIAIATQKRIIEKTISNIKEVKARGAKVVLICAPEVEVGKDVADYVIHLPKTDDIFYPMAAAVPMQLIAYYCSALKGNDVDKPRNLAKSVTVE
ncbi:MAG: glutamine--fructose-6-phosphate transaminase (isomerizing) [Lachnospira sp.]|nr:glutamine--fructose-6-phosphate transaminase (isomerizing) [Lachnospira sp.]